MELIEKGDKIVVEMYKERVLTVTKVRPRHLLPSLVGGKETYLESLISTKEGISLPMASPFIKNVRKRNTSNR